MTTKTTVDAVLVEFEKSWQDGTTPSIELALQEPPCTPSQIDPDTRFELLAQLICLDLQYRWQRQRHADLSPNAPRDAFATALFSHGMLLESYLKRFPELRGRPDTVVRLAVEEYRMRCLWSEPPGHGEYSERFPDYPQIADKLRQVDSQLRNAAEAGGGRSFVRLEVTHGPHTGAALLIDRFETLLAGRSPDAQLQLDRDAYFSRYHFRLEINPPACRLMDLQSANGTYVNGQRVTEAFLKHGDEISGGQTRIALRIDSLRKTVLEIASTQDQPRPPHTVVEQGASDLPSELTQVGEYELRRELGRGGMGVVYEAVQLSTQRKVALKLITPASAVSEHVVGLFVREACILAQLRHPRIVESLEFGMHDRQFFLAMEYLDTVDFMKLLQTQSPPSQIRLACGITCRILEALDFAHQRGFVHRDVKPANILTFYVRKKLSAKLADFGLAKNYTNAGFSAISDDEDMKGTLAYIAPEQILNCRYAKPPCDIYSTGASLYFFLTGCTPHDFGNSQSAIATLLNNRPVPIRDRQEGLPQCLSQAVDRSLARKPEDRFATAQEFHQVLSEFVRK